MILNDLSKNLVDFRERFGQKLTAKLRKHLSTKKKRTQQQYDFIKNQRFLKKNSIFSWKCLKSWWLSEFRRLGGLFFFGIVQNHGFREFELVTNLSGIVGFTFDYATEYFQSLFTTDFSVLAELFIDSLAFFSHMVQICHIQLHTLMSSIM